MTSLNLIGSGPKFQALLAEVAKVAPELGIETGPP
jgi:hypothetical protein